LLATFLWNRSPDVDQTPAASSDVPAAPAPTPEPSPAPAAAATAPAAAAERSTESAIVTERQVWMRVIADGERVLEREVPAGTRIPLKAEKTIVIRTGDAGAVRLSIRGGQSTPLGREGEVVTRSFTVPPRARKGAEGEGR
jgi:cytoskeleton protein RodZ